jgi:hypothetical protein
MPALNLTRDMIHLCKNHEKSRLARCKPASLSWNVTGLHMIPSLIPVRASVVLRALAVVTLSLVVGSSIARGQRARRSRIPDTSRALESLKSLKCAFPASAWATWEGGEPQAQAGRLPSAAVLTITSIDTQEGSAQIDGAGFRAADHVTVKLTGSTLHFLDIGLNGTLGVLTVFARESHDGRLQAVYSRAAYVESRFGESAPPTMSQFYGDCETGSR